MDSHELFDKYKHFARRNLLILALGSAGLILFAYGLISLFLSSKPIENDMIFQANEADSGNILNSAKEEKLTVDIEGSVMSPGVYHLPFNSRIQDAIAASGGLSAAADKEFIARNINLAIKLSDGAKIYIPKIGEFSANTNVMGETAVIGSTAQININSASEQELDALPGIGPVTSQKIINGRPYSSIEDLIAKKIVGSKVFEEIKGKISVY